MPQSSYALPKIGLVFMVPAIEKALVPDLVLGILALNSFFSIVDCRSLFSQSFRLAVRPAYCDILLVRSLDAEVFFLLNAYLLDVLLIAASIVRLDVCPCEISLCYNNTVGRVLWNNISIN